MDSVREIEADALRCACAMSTGDAGLGRCRLRRSREGVGGLGPLFYKFVSSFFF